MKWQSKVAHSADVGRLPRRAAMVVLATALSGTLLAEVATEPSWAGSAHTSEPAALGGFALGDGLEGLVDPGAGAFSFTLPAAGLAVSWDSRASGVDRAGLGGGWSIAGVAHVSTQGGVQVTPASGGVYAADATAPSGLAGYLPRDLVFAQHPKTVPARADGQRGEQAAAFELLELGGVRTYFSAAGDPVVRFDANGNRADWEWRPGHRLVRAIDHTGLVSALDWSDPGRVEVTTGAGHAWAVTATLELDGGRLVTVTDASGGRVHVGYTGTGLVERLSAGSGANTEVTWQRLDDGRSAVDRVRVVDASTGAELSARRWEARAGSASGWPSLGEAAGATLRDDTADGYLTTVTDGSTSIGTAFDAAHRVLERDMTVTARGGALVVQRQTYTYPERDGGGEMPAQSGQPTEATVTHFDASGAQRTERVTFASDELGRVTLALDGTRYTYDATNQPVTETTPDGVTIRTGYWASGQRATHTQDDTTAATVFHWDGTTLLNDTHTSPEASGTAAYLLGVGRHARTLGSPASTVFSEADFHGNVTELTGPDANVTTSYDYTDYGATTTRQHTDDEPDAGPLVGDAHRNPFQYAGEYTNPTGTQHLQVRTYDPTTMRLTSVDPEPQHNRYHYAALNPITLADPTGRISDLPAWAYAVLAGIGLGLSLVGVAVAGLGVAAAVATAAPTIGAKVGLFSTIAAATVDLGVTALTTAHHYKPDFLNTDVAFGLGVAGAMVGVLTAVAGFGVRAMNRLEIDAYVEEGAGPALASYIIAKEKRIAKQAQAAYAEFGLHYDVNAIRQNLHVNVKAASMAPKYSSDLSSEQAWDAHAHHTVLNELLEDVPTRRGSFADVDETFATKLRPLENAERYAPYVFPGTIQPMLSKQRKVYRPEFFKAHPNGYTARMWLLDPEKNLAYSDRYGYLKRVFPKNRSGGLHSHSAPTLPTKNEPVVLEVINEEL
ncbi:RHS repeat domain-containing protein [Agromyces silvae]|uniref:RHS repeat domain-containing protein n=1 Tax=Agromyces silvae TaxID=3388266 RepID=UPI00280ABED6|nr:RHS repeat-associated core domain-containing protein [Agromyces protaetiae]